MPITTTSTLPPAVQASFDQAILSTPTRNFIYNIAAEKRRMPRNGGDTIRFKRLKLVVLKSSLIDLEAEVVFN